jgi:hypothetical protein
VCPFVVCIGAEIGERGEQCDFGVEKLGDLWVHVKSAIFSEALLLVPAEGLRISSRPLPASHGRYPQWAGIERAAGNGGEQLASFLAIFLAQ